MHLRMRQDVLNENVDLSDSHKRTLKRHRALLHKLVLKKTSMKNKKKILQTGGFLGALLGPIVKVLGSLFGIGNS